MVASRRRFWGGFGVGVAVVVLLGMFRLPVIAQLAGGFVAGAIAGGLGRGAAVGYMSAFVGTFIDAILTGFMGQLYRTGIHAFGASQSSAGFSALLGTIMACVGISFAGLIAGLVGGPLGTRLWPKAEIPSTTQDQKRALAK